MSSPRTSIIMPVYNTADTVIAAMESVLAQTDPDFELLVVVDGSPDCSSKVIREFLQNTPDPRIRLFDNEQNAGVSAARNQGLDEARGEWITFIDSDDTYRPEFLERYHAAAARNGADCGNLRSHHCPRRRLHDGPPAGCARYVHGSRYCHQLSKKKVGAEPFYGFCAR